MKISWMASIIIFSPALACAAPALAPAYKSPSGIYRPTKMVSEIGANGAPRVATYKDSSGVWRSAEIVQNICGLDANDAPVVCNDINSSDIGQPNGVAGTDANGNVTANILSSVLTASPVTSAGAQPLVNVGRFPIFTNITDAAASDPWQSPDAFVVGGLPTQGWAANGLAANTQARPGSLVVNGQPWGPYNAGAIESVLWGTDTDQQNGIANVDWRAGAVPPFDGVAQYVGVANTAAMIVAPAQFAAGSVTISPALTAAQIAELRVGMYISTNITSSQVPTTATANWVGAAYPKTNFYQGIISSWKQTTDASGNPVTVITVPAWDSWVFTTHSTTAVPGSQAGDGIDTVRSNYGVPMVFIGNDVGEAARNEYIYYNGRKSVTPDNGGKATSLSHDMGYDEVDLRYYATQENELYVSGLTLSLGAMGGSPVGRKAITSGSYLLNLSSGDAPNLLILDGASDANVIQGHSFYLHGQEGSFFPTGSTAGADGIRQVQTNFAFMDYADSANAMNLISYQMAYGTGTGYANTSYHIGLHTDGDIMKPTTTGYNQGEIEWNPLGTNQGSIGLCANGEKCGLIVNGNGAALAPNGMTVTGNVSASGNVATGAGGNVTFTAPDSNGVSAYTSVDDGANLIFHASNGAASYANLKAATFTATASLIAPLVTTANGVGPADPSFALAALPTAGLSDGQRAWCTDCKLNSITGVVAVWHATAEKWTDTQNNALSSSN